MTFEIVSGKVHDLWMSLRHLTSVRMQYVQTTVTPVVRTYIHR